MSRGGGCSSRPSNDPDVSGCANKVAPLHVGPSVIFDVAVAILKSLSLGYYLLSCFFSVEKTGRVLRSCDRTVACCSIATYL